MIINNRFPLIEQWKDISGFNGKYLISNLGRVKSVAKKWNPGGEKILNPVHDKDGYEQVTITQLNGKNKAFYIHRLVAYHFVSTVKPAGAFVCHIDGNRTNNVYTNLYVGTMLSNVKDRYLQKRTVLSIEQIREIRALIGTMPQTKIAEMYGVKQSYISRLHTRKRGGWIE